MLLFSATGSGAQDLQSNHSGEPKRIVIFKIDGLGADLLYSTMRQNDPNTGKSRLPWFSKIFAQDGVIFENFYSRGISLSAPSWSMLDTGRHGIIRGNVEYDRYTGQVYDYLNFFPFYLGYARGRQIDMPAVEELDRARIPLLIDAFPHEQRFQSFQLFQRGVRWSTLQQALKRRFSSKMIIAMVESAGTPSVNETLTEQMEAELKAALKQPEVFYCDLFTGEVDHQGHATNQSAALLDVLRRLDAQAGRIWTAIQASPLAEQTLFVVVSDHGMNNVPGITSQTFSLPDLFNSAEGGAHHVITNRHQLSDYKLRGLDPLVSRVTTPSTDSFYLSGESSRYPTAWLDIDGNERTSVGLRNSDLNKIHILLQELARPDLPADCRKAAALCLRETIDRHRDDWSKNVIELEEEMRSLQQAIDQRKKLIETLPRKWTAEQWAGGEDKRARRLAKELEDWEREHAQYTAYAAHLRALLRLQPDPEKPFREKIGNFVPEMSLGDNNDVRDLQHYIAGPSSEGLIVDTNGRLDEERSFRHVNYFSLLARQRVRNNPQPQLSSAPIDFVAMRLPDGLYVDKSEKERAYWLYGDEEKQLLILVNEAGQIALKPVSHLQQGPNGKIFFTVQEWRPGLPLGLFEDSELHLPGNADRAAWLSSWHNEREWMRAIHQCRYSNGVIGLIEDLSPIGDYMPDLPGMYPILLRYERHRRELVQADFQIFATDHWNFNVRFPNPGGNHGSFLRISTHSVWMIAGAGLPNEVVNEPYDSLNFASTILKLAGRPAPMPERIVPLTTH